MSSDPLLGVLAATLHGAAYVLYNVGTYRGRSQPKSATWAIWAGLVLLNLFTFRAMSRSWWVSLQFVIGTAGSIGTFVFALLRRRLAWPNFREWATIALGGFAGVIWIAFRNASWANAIVVVGVAVGFQPLYASVREWRQREWPLPWILWGLAYAVTLTNVAVNGSGFVSHANPIILGALHSSIGIIALHGRHQASLFRSAQDRHIK